MDKDKKLQQIFENDPLGLLSINPSTSSVQSEDERLVSSFQEICNFYKSNGRAPKQGEGIKEHQLYSRLQAIRESSVKRSLLVSHDEYGLLNYEQKQINSIDDILDDDTLGLLDDDSQGLFDFRHVNISTERASADFVARRNPCKDFDKYEPSFKQVQKDLSTKKRLLITFKEKNLKVGSFYIHNGVLLYLESVNFMEEEQHYNSGARLRRDGRTRVVFENGTESNMLYRSLYKALLANGKAVSDNVDTTNENIIENFNDVTDEDAESGYIYVLKSKSDKKELREIMNLYKIGFSKIAIEERIKKASQEPTYLMADVRIVMTYKCYNVNPQKLEQLLHTFFGHSCLNIDVFDNNGNRHTPREWFIAPLEVIDESIRLIISGEIVNYVYDNDNEVILKR